MPLSEAFTDHGPVMQYFERARLEIAAGGVRESPLGSLLTAGRAFPPLPSSPATVSSHSFAATRHSLSGRFLGFCTRHRGQLLFGAPISQQLTEQNGDGTGRTYIVQYLQNARLEYHPEFAGTGNDVQLGLLGRQYLQQTGYPLCHNIPRGQSRSHWQSALRCRTRRSRVAPPPARSARRRARGQVPRVHHRGAATDRASAQGAAVFLAALRRGHTFHGAARSDHPPRGDSSGV